MKAEIKLSTHAIIKYINNNNESFIYSTDSDEVSWSANYNGNIFMSGAVIYINNDIIDNITDKENNIDKLNVLLKDISGCYNDRHIVSDNIQFELKDNDVHIVTPIFVFNENNTDSNINNHIESKMLKNTFNTYYIYNKEYNNNNNNNDNIYDEVKKVTFSVSASCIHIDSSYLIRDLNEMLNVLYYIKSLYTVSSNIYDNWIINRLSIDDMINEWQSHNLLYDLHIFRSHTADVDINENPWYIKLPYCIMSVIYEIFNK